jgi:hypothetical protein
VIVIGDGDRKGTGDSVSAMEAEEMVGAEAMLLLLVFRLAMLVSCMAGT